MAESSKNSKDINLESLEPNPSARVGGIVTAILPMKVGKSYYDSELSDNHASLIFCGFSATAQRKLEECYENSKLVLLEVCEIKS